MKVTPLYEGTFSVDASKKFIPFDPAKDTFNDRPASLFISIQPFLVETASDLIVCDTGLGYTDASGELMIHSAIRKAGHSPEAVSLVLMSHLHFDHSGGMIDNRSERPELTFPHAEYVINRGEWETAYSTPSSSYATGVFDVLQRSGSIRFIEGSGQLTSGISYELTGGHCEYHQVFLIEENGENVFFGGDILPEPEQVIRKFIAKYDFDGRLAMKLREAYGKRAAAEAWSCLFYHAKKEPVGKIAYDGETFTVRPA